jgi:hypothetical protein
MHKTGMTMTRKDIRLYCRIFLVLLLPVLLTSCSKQAPVQKLKKISFAFSVANDQKVPAFQRVQQIQLDGQGNLYVMDSENRTIYKFDGSGRFQKLLCSPGKQLGQLDRVVSFNIYRDSLLIIHNQGVLDFLTMEGKPVRELSLAGRADITVRDNGLLFINRMMDAVQWQSCIQVLDLNGKLLDQFKHVRGPYYKSSQADFAFVGHLSNDRIVYAPAVLDSVFLYDLKGRLLKGVKRIGGEKPPKDTDQAWPCQVEDLYVHNDKAYLLLADKVASTEDAVYFQKIAMYDANLKLERIFELPQAITMSIPTEQWAPWYHKFLVTGNRFLFMVSQPADHIEAYEY